MLPGYSCGQDYPRNLLRSYHRGCWARQSIARQTGCGSGVPSNHGERGLSSDGRCALRWQRRQRQHKAVAASFLIFLTLACGLSCSRSESPQAAFEHAQRTFRHGDLTRSQQETEEGCQRFLRSSPEWAWKFRILQADSLLWRGKSHEAIDLLNSQPAPTKATESLVEMLAIEGVAYARLHKFPESERSLDHAGQLCATTPVSLCGN